MSVGFSNQQSTLQSDHDSRTISFCNLTLFSRILWKLTCTYLTLPSPSPSDYSQTMSFNGQRTLISHLLWTWRTAGSASAGNLLAFAVGAMRDESKLTRLASRGRLQRRRFSPASSSSPISERSACSASTAPRKTRSASRILCVSCNGTSRGDSSASTYKSSSELYASRSGCLRLRHVERRRWNGWGKSNGGGRVWTVRK